VYLQFLQDIRHVMFDRFFRQVQLQPDLFIARAGCNQRQYFMLALGQFFESFRFFPNKGSRPGSGACGGRRRWTARYRAGNPVFGRCARPFVPNNQEQKTVDRQYWIVPFAVTLPVAEKRVPGGHFPGIVPRDSGLKGVVLGFVSRNNRMKVK
jgi:hypothetical protein